MNILWNRWCWKCLCKAEELYVHVQQSDGSGLEGIEKRAGLDVIWDEKMKKEKLNGGINYRKMQQVKGSLKERGEK